MNRREALKKIGAGSAVGIPAAMLSIANAREADTNDPYEGESTSPNTERPLTQASLEEAVEILRKAGYELEGRIMAIGYRTPDQMENALDGLAETMKTHCRENNVDSAAFKLIISKLPEGEK